MILQEHICIAGVLRHGASARLEPLLTSMNGKPGQADPDNGLFPFGKLDQLHVARFVILDDHSLGDRTSAPVLPVREPVYLAFVADFDGDADVLVENMASLAAPGLAQIFSHCRDFHDDTDLRAWLDSHRIRSAATYVNWVGRSTRQIREEALLHDALRSARLANPRVEPEELLPILKDSGAGVQLTPLEKRSFAARVREALHFLILPVVGLILSPLLLVLAPFFAIMLRRREKRDPVLAPVPARERNDLLRDQEDHDITNQYSALGSLKPGLFRRGLTILILWIINWGARHLYNKGRLARVNTIHFASWTFFDNKRRVYFASNYDGSREAYNDDFINKVAFGLNLSFSNGLGYPRTRWLILDGAWNEQDFKRYLFHHQLPTQVWYKAFPGLSNYDMARNARIRSGFERTLSGDALRRWISEI
ncbi:MAG TPA: hypothetical protein VFH89_11830 [Sphingomicrobium sp.]|nr:hypothetical protein [Sphingomicrobium sp.]